HRAAARLLLDRTQVTVARHRRRTVGFIALKDGAVQSLYLTRPARGQGIGRSLLDHAKSRHHRLELWTFQANTNARRFYARHGFYENRLTNGEGNDQNLPDVHLVWARSMA
ncbi:MAG: GNAT family N-acetyltransferase, partial [Paracoccaceae bacterium]